MQREALRLHRDKSAMPIWTHEVRPEGVTSVARNQREARRQAESRSDSPILPGVPKTEGPLYGTLLFFARKERTSVARRATFDKSRQQFRRRRRVVDLKFALLSLVQTVKVLKDELSHTSFSLRRQFIGCIGFKQFERPIVESPGNFFTPRL